MCVDHNSIKIGFFWGGGGGAVGLGQLDHHCSVKFIWIFFWGGGGAGG